MSFRHLRTLFGAKTYIGGNLHKEMTSFNAIMMIWVLIASRRLPLTFALQKKVEKRRLSRFSRNLLRETRGERVNKS